MDPFEVERPELNGTLMSLEFGQGGRIQQLWASDPGSQQDSEEFQFVAPPVQMGEEVAEDYYPGTILLGARMDPEDPWIVSRNTRAEHTGDDDDPSVVTFEYEFSFLEDLEATGKFYELGGRLPEVVWELSIRNRSRRSIEIGELGFPLALNNVLDGFSRTDLGTREMFYDRVHVHKFIGGAASYIYAQRMPNVGPGLLIYPGGDTRWEFINHVQASLNTNYQWDGIPVVYIHSRAAMEREEWPEWFFGHSSTVLEPGETRRYEMRFTTTNQEGPINALHLVGRPCFKLFPAAVAPIDSHISLEIAGATPTRFWTDLPVEMENDSDEHGGYCQVWPKDGPGTIRVGFEDSAGRDSETQILFTRPIAELIQARCDWILENQVVREGHLRGAIVSADNMSAEAFTDIRHFTNPFALKCAIGEALFLAEKNASQPLAQEVEALNEFVDFFETTIRNPADGSVGCVLPTTTGTAACFAFPDVYPVAALFYGAMARIAAVYGARRKPNEYLKLAGETATAMWRHALSDPQIDHPIPLLSYLPGLADQLDSAGLIEQAGELRMLLDHRWTRMAERKYPFAPGGYWEPEAFEEVVAAARHSGNLELKDRAFRCLAASKSLSPCWWWYGADKRWGVGIEGNDAALDNGELCQGASSVANSALLFSIFQRDYAQLPEQHVRLAFAGMLGLWSLIRDDGAAGMAFCPDPASAHFGMAPTTGDIGLAMYHYLRHAGAYVLPSLGRSLLTFGCRFDVEEDRQTEIFTIVPWDGVGRRIVVRQVGMEVETSAGRLEELQFDARKRNARISLQNASDKDLTTELIVKGMWGRRVNVAGVSYAAEAGAVRIPVQLPAMGKARIDIEVCE
ncbi:MAG TPA: DUF5695 domain-containing protein [Fimbriimonas sp.]|nr:DUF5695 domain-containing protein [Fimbriimonas sp.]